MSLSFHPRLVNGPFDDPGLFIPFSFRKRAFMFDLGEMNTLSSKDIIKISHIFITHTHMDHFVGFDRLLRLLLGREKDIYLFGPEGFLKNVEGKLAGYSWNLVDNFENRLALHVTEVRQEQSITREYLCQDRFIPVSDIKERPFTEVLLDEPGLLVSCLHLDHGTPSLGFSLKEQFHVNIKKEAVAKMGFETGPWLNEFKQALYSGMNPDSEFKVNVDKGAGAPVTFILGELSEKIAVITPGQKITYIADTGCSRDNLDKIVLFASESDHLFIEAAFLEKDREMAKQKHHLTAWQAGSIAGRAKVKRFTLFHFSPRYTDEEQIIQEEAEKAYQACQDM